MRKFTIIVGCNTNRMRFIYITPPWASP